MSRPRCVICDAECTGGRRTYCSARCADVVYAPAGRRTLRQHVERELFLARETYARQEPDAKSHDLKVHIVHLEMWLTQLVSTGAGERPINAPRAHRASTDRQQLALPEVA